MVEWFPATGLVFAKILEELAKDSAKEWAKDFCKESLKDVLGHKDEWANAAGKALKSFLEEFQGELVGADETTASFGKYEDSLERFTKNKEFRLVIGQALTMSDMPIDVSSLVRLWKALDCADLPGDFDWQKMCRRYRGRTVSILESSDKLREILNSRALLTIRDTIQHPMGDFADFNLVGYRDTLKKRFEWLKLELLDAGASVPMHLLRVFVEQNVRDCQQFNPRIHELPLEHRRHLREKSAFEHELESEEIERLRQAYFDQATRPALAVLRDPTQRLFVILGDPGAGKSILLQYLALEWAQRPIVELEAHPIPLLIELKTFAECLRQGHCRNFLEYIDRGPGACGHLDQHSVSLALDKGNAFFALDGLDEIFDHLTRQTVISEVLNIAARYPLVRIILTSRIVGYEFESLRNAGFRHYILQDLEREQIRHFSEKWHALVFSDSVERNKYHSRLQHAIDGTAPVRELAQNPLLLTLMALLNRHQELPRDRSELYEQASRLLLQQWDASRALQADPLLADKSFDYKDKQSMLRAVALRMQTSPQGLAGNIISAADLKTTMVAWLQTLGYVEPQAIADRLISQLRERNFILCLLGNDYYSFVHRTFLEFFCAWAFTWMFEKEKTLTLEQLQSSTFDAHWQDETWHEILRLIASRLEPVFSGKLIEELLKKTDLTHKNRHLFLASKCLSDVRNRAELEGVSSRLLGKMQDLISFDLAFLYRPWDEGGRLVSETRSRAVAAVASTWPTPATALWLKEKIFRARVSGNVAEAAVRELARGWKDDPSTLRLLKELVSGRSRVRSDFSALTEEEEERSPDKYKAAVQELARGWKDDPDTLVRLKDCASSQDVPWPVRQAAIQELASEWKEDPGVLSILSTCVQSDKHWAVRQAAVRELARGWKDDIETLALVRNILRDEDVYVREVVVHELARGWPNDPKTFETLRKLALSDRHYIIRQVALQELARIWCGNSEVLALLNERACADDDPDVRCTAIRELARGWKSDAGTLLLIKNRIQSDKDPSVRKSALQELAHGWQEDIDVLPLLKEHARSGDAEIRKVAVQELARGWKDDPDTLPILKECAKSDTDVDVLKAVIEDLVRIWHDDPEVLDILKLMCSHSHWTVHQAALEALANGWGNNEGVTRFLEQAETRYLWR